MDIDAFVQTIDDGREHLQLTDQEKWTSTIRGGMTIIMSIVVSQLFQQTKGRCPFCVCWNSMKGNDEMSLMDPFNSADGVSVDPASDGSRSFRPIEMLTRRKLREFPTTNRT